MTILRYDPSKITVSFGSLKFDGFGLRVEEVRRSPWRVMLDLRLAELVYRDACEAGTRTADEVTALLSICNDLRDELAVDVRDHSHWPCEAPRAAPSHELGAATTTTDDVPWFYGVDPARFHSTARRLKRRIWAFLAETPKVRPGQLENEVRRLLEERGLLVEDVALRLQAHDELTISYRAREPHTIQSLSITGTVEI